MNPQEYREEIQAAVDDLLLKMEGASFGKFSLEIKVHAGELRQIDVSAVESIRLDGRRPGARDG